MSDVFLSYASEDRQRIAGLVRGLELAGVQVFWDREVPPGLNWRRVLDRELGTASVVLVAWSHNSVQSEWVVEEAEEARTLARLLPIRIDPIDAPLGFRHVQTLDLEHWTGSPDDPALSALIGSVLSRLALPQAPSPRAGARVHGYAGSSTVARDVVQVLRLLQAFIYDYFARLFRVLTSIGGAGYEPRAMSRTFDAQVIGFALLSSLIGYVLSFASFRKVYGSRSLLDITLTEVGVTVCYWLAFGALACAVCKMLGGRASAAATMTILLEQLSMTFVVGWAATVVAFPMLEVSDVNLPQFAIYVVLHDLLFAIYFVRVIGAAQGFGWIRRSVLALTTVAGTVPKICLWALMQISE